ncbi:MAG: hypothetical protein JST93_05320 [Acidobacteria bacterium]|nr:hypothetical protein [Acidobacteriota bacterium]
MRQRILIKRSRSTLWLAAASLCFGLAQPALGQIANVVVTSAASFEQLLPPVGGLAAIFCTGLPGIEGIVQAGEFPLPFELAGVTVTIGGAPAPILAVAPGNGYQQINVQVPRVREFTAEGVPVVIRSRGTMGTGIVHGSSSPGDFFRLPLDPYRPGNPAGVFQHASDFSLVTAENPARPGETIIAYLTGIPVRTVPEVPTGEPSPSSPPALVPRVLEPITFPRSEAYFTMRFVGPTRAPEVAPGFLGLAPGLAGVFQANFTVPSTVELGLIRLFFVRHRWVGLGGSSPETIQSTQVFIPIGPPLP